MFIQACFKIFHRVTMSLKSYISLEQRIYWAVTFWVSSSYLSLVVLKSYVISKCQIHIYYWLFLSHMSNSYLSLVVLKSYVTFKASNSYLSLVVLNSYVTFKVSNSYLSASLTNDDTININLWLLVICQFQTVSLIFSSF